MSSAFDMVFRIRAGGRTYHGAGFAKASIVYQGAPLLSTPSTIEGLWTEGARESHGQEESWSTTVKSFAVCAQRVSHDFPDRKSSGLLRRALPQHTSWHEVRRIRRPARLHLLKSKMFA